MCLLSITEWIADLTPSLGPKWLHSALLLAMFSTFVVIGVLAYLNRFERRPCMNFWMIAWTLYAFWLGTCIHQQRAGITPWLLMLERACVGASALCMFWGSLAMLGSGRSLRELLGALVLIAVWSYVATHHVREHLWITVPVFVLLAASSIFIGKLYGRDRNKYHGAGLLMGGFVLWGVHLLIFPFQPFLNPVPLVLAYYATSVLAFFIALGMVVLTLEQARERHSLALQELQRTLASHQHLELQAAMTEQKYRALFQASGEAILVVDLQTLELLETNNAAKQLLCGSRPHTEMPEELPAILPQLTPSAGAIQQNFAQISAIVHPARTFNIRRTDGSLVECEGTVTRVEFNRRPTALITLRDVSERRKIEQQLRRSEKLSALGQLVAGVAHELNNPLAVIMGYAQILTSQDHPPARVRGDLLKILHESERAAKIVRNLLNFARPREPQLAPTDLNALITTVLENHESEMESAGIVYRLHLQPNLPATMADPDQIEQVLTNILTNAIQALAEHRGRRQLDVRTELRTNTIHISIADTGPGIPPEIQAKIFDPFFTTKGPGKGTGLGLTICHSIIEEHHGKIFVESEPARGTCVHIELPLRPCTPQPSATTPKPALAPTRPHPPERPQPRILLVDDEPGILEVLKAILEEDGYLVETATNGTQALKQIQSASYDLIITDLCMPDIGGDTIYERLQATSPALARRLIFITGDTVSPSSRAFLERTGNRWFGKPFDLEEIQRTVREHLQQTS
ncbi:MAG: ATP-binding protein [Verrucomicrobiae bacterium]|nr:ATP-binding protein [Verrucomicrobiae bacterium]